MPSAEPTPSVEPTPAPSETPGPTPAPAAAPAPSELDPAEPIAAPGPSGASPDAAVQEQAQDPRERFKHAGAVADVRIGTLGCIGGLCRAQGHDVRPGVRVGGFLGGNIRGWVEIGLGGGWGTMRPNIEQGTNVLVLHGLNPNVLQQALLAQAAGLIDFNFASLAVNGDARLRATQVGPSLRVHILPRGRFGAFVGSGVGYNGLNARYDTAAGDLKLSFHGINVPVEANFSVYVLPRLAVGVQFDYLWTWYGLAVINHPEQRAAVPMGVLQAAAQQQGVDLRGQLPQFWTLGLNIRGRL